MENGPLEVQRRFLLRLATGVAAASGPALGAEARADAASPASAPRPAATGRPGDFDFLSGEWRIDQRRLKDGAWDHFKGEATVHGLLRGVASVEELRIPSRNFSGLGLRLLDVERSLWADFWVNAASGVLDPSPSWGSFVNGAGTWDTEAEEDGRPVIWRGRWDEITPKSCRWTQSVSRDGARSWQEQWVMHWTRVDAAPGR